MSQTDTTADRGGTDDPANSARSVADRLRDVRDRIAAACSKANRDLADVTVIAVTKTASLDQIREVIRLGINDLGESKVQNLLLRIAALGEPTPAMVQPGARIPPGRIPPPALATGAAAAAAPLPKLRWHMIGHMQRNKVKQAMPHVVCVHSVDSLRLAEEIDVAAIKAGGRNASVPPKKFPVMLQVNASEEPQKFGVAVGAAVHLGEQIALMDNVQLVGLMTMAAETADEKTARQTFARTREIFEEMKWQKIGGPGFRHLSMGMSNDYEAAVLEGATMLRLGSALFGKPAMPDTDDDD